MPKRITYRQSQCLYGGEQGTGAYRTGKPYGRTPTDMEIKQAEAQKKSAIGQNNAAKEVAESNAELEVTKAEASRKAGEAQARTQAAVLTAQENAQREIEEAKARKVEQALKADKIVPAEIAKQQAILDAGRIGRANKPKGKCRSGSYPGQKHRRKKRPSR